MFAFTLLGVILGLKGAAEEPFADEIKLITFGFVGVSTGTTLALATGGGALSSLLMTTFLFDILLMKLIIDAVLLTGAFDAMPGEADDVTSDEVCCPPIKDFFDFDLVVLAADEGEDSLFTAFIEFYIENNLQTATQKST